MEILSAEGSGKLLGHKPTSSLIKYIRFFLRSETAFTEIGPELLQKIAYSYQKYMAIYHSLTVLLLHLHQGDQ